MSCRAFQILFIERAPVAIRVAWIRIDYNNVKDQNVGYKLP